MRGKGKSAGKRAKGKSGIACVKAGSVFRPRFKAVFRHIRAERGASGGERAERGVSSGERGVERRERGKRWGRGWGIERGFDRRKGASTCDAWTAKKRGFDLPRVNSDARTAT